MDFDERYRIIQSRDSRFDGQFITAVRSTGIYCRPSCPARTPKPANVTFYVTSAAAHEAGYRACKRCLPEAVPGTPDWNLRGDLAGRAMRLIGDGVVEREGVDGLAAQLGYSSRHLARVLQHELGAGPLALARAHRAQTARTLLTSTALSMSDIAFAAGFASIRQFNDTVAEVFQLTPSEIRSRSAAADGAAPGSISLALPYREPFDAAGVFTWLAERAIPGVEVAEPDSYHRSLLLPGGPARFTVRFAHSGAGRLMLDARLTALSDLPTLVARIRRLFDLDADPSAIDEALVGVGHEAVAARVNAVPGIRMPGAVDAHEMLFRAILGQQITVVAARTLLHRLAAAAGTPLAPAHRPDHRPGPAGAGPTGAAEPAEPMVGAGSSAAAGSPRASSSDAALEPTLLFPTAAQIAEHAESVLTGPRAKIATVVAVARALADGSLELSFGDDAGEQRRGLTAFAGIGDWTAGYVSMRVLGRPDELLTGDVAIRSGARALGAPDAPRALSEWAAAYSPWRSYLSLHLWRAAADAKRAPAGGTPAPPTTPTAATTPRTRSTRIRTPEEIS
ncbi:MAG: DNA-3-methyladenine glycosylase 2 family protein [Herbiconiux sp.]|uniref:AlkA N-terminal domain-containing protein n=1 Tax=Herbiconiux sp. TaxID=1871186 RepID=UPI00120FA370|nr:AlkA N-terminal domain-containing protein [Herbiconiux sp.]TAJ46792.1 MAG: DNA-3-methyladenine glycosylase 2 family protein [Herbiconiux sp.]